MICSGDTHGTREDPLVPSDRPTGDLRLLRATRHAGAAAGVPARHSSVGGDPRRVLAGWRLGLDGARSHPHAARLRIPAAPWATVHTDAHLGNGPHWRARSRSVPRLAVRWPG